MTIHSPDIAEFIGVLYRPDDIIEVCVIWPKKEDDKPTQSRWVVASQFPTDETLLGWMAEKNAQRWGIYVGANPRRESGGRNGAAVPLARSLFVDFDGGTTLEDARRMIHEAGLPPPTILVESGYGVHAYWQLDTPMTDLAAWSGVMRAMILLLKTDDCIHDAPRVMRLPGLLNTKYDTTRPCRLVEAVPGRVYSLAQFPNAAKPPTALPTGPARPYTGTATPYAAAALRAEAETVAAAPEGTRNDTLNKSAFKLGTLAGAGYLDQAQLESELGAAAERSGLPESEIYKTITSGVTAGMKKPRARKNSIKIRGVASMSTSGPRTAYRPFPIDALPDVLRRYIEPTARRMDADLILFVSPALSLFAAAVGNSVRIVVDQDWTEPCAIWTAIVAQPSSMKSPSQEKALRPVYEAQRLADADHEKNLREYELRAFNHEAAMDAAKRAARLGQPAESLPASPDKPVRTQWFASNTTWEALAHVMHKNPRGLLSEHDELAAFFGSFALYKSGNNAAEPGAGFYKSAWSGRTYVENRKGNGGTYICIESPLLSITGSIQPQTLERVLGRQYIEDGLASRFLRAQPPDCSARIIDGHDDLSAELGKRYAAIHAILRAIPLGVDPAGTLTSVHLGLTRAAFRLAAQWWNTIMVPRVREANPALRAAFGKLKGYVFRFALLLHLIDWAESGNTPLGTVGEDAMRRALAVVGWYADEAARVYGLLGESDQERETHELVERIAQGGKGRKPGAITARLLMREMPRIFTNAPAADAALAALVEAGYGTMGPLESGPAGGHPVRWFGLNAKDTTSGKSDDSEGSVNGGDGESPPDGGPVGGDGREVIDL